MAELAGVGWALSIAGWIMSPITTRLMNEGFSLIGFDESEKLRDLETRLLPRLAQMLEEAERSPPSLRRAHVEQWAKRLRSAFYDAEDILDVADYHRLEKQVISHSHIKLKLDRVQHIISGETSKLKKILKKLEKIIEEGSQFLSPLASTINNANVESNPAAEVTRIVTTSSGPAQVIIGRDEERDMIIRMLHEAPGDSKCYSVVGIYGVAGSGKTTLAQHVRSHERTEDHFCPIMWIHVSQSFDVRRIYQEMLEAASGEPSCEFSNLDTLQMRLEAELRGKRFLLVLDDIWADKGVSVHNLDQLLSPLKVGKRGSKVLVTTRFKDAAMSLGAQSLIPIPDLNQNDFFSLFMHYALDGASLNDHEQEIFLMIGREIVKKLKGSPLAARLVGARLRKKLNASFWRRVVDQDLLTDTMGALWWSYRHLDEHVRRCFAYCSIFPRWPGFERNELVKLWMAEDFIKTTNDGDQMEDVGQDYFDELVSCSFLQTGEWDKEWFTMHDLLHELAEMVAGNDFFRVEDGELKEFPHDVRHLFINLNDPMEVTEQICKMKKLRTLIFPNYEFGSGITEQVLEGMLKKLKKLRVVRVPLEGDMVMIPTRICDLKHLRCLTIYSPMWRSICELKVYLPRKFGKLYHLQILELFDSGVYSNVKNMTNLISLRHIRTFPGFEDSDFPGVGKLKSLQELSDFRVRKEKGYELQQLESLNYLHGSLRISGLENVESKERALEAKLADKKYLTVLSLAWSPKQRYSPGLEVEIIEGLCPPSQLTELRVDGYDGWECPSWLSQNENALRGLQCLEIRRCSNLEAIPEIGEVFVNLRELRLSDLDKLKRLPRLPDNLKSLHIGWLEDMVVTCVEDVEMIRSMLIERASQIEPSLKIANTEEIDMLADEQPDRFMEILCDTAGGSGGNVYFRRRIRRMVSSIVPFIRGQIREEEYPQWLLPASLDRLRISCCTITETVLHDCLNGCTALTTLQLYGTPFLRAIPCEVMKSIARLRDLRIDDSVNLTLLQGLNYLGHLEVLDIRKCPNLKPLQEGEKVRVRLDLTVDDISLVPQLLSREACSSLTSLEILRNQAEPSVQSSEEPSGEEILRRLTSLKSLRFRDCKWNSLPENLVNLISLQLLTLDSCRNIRSLPTLPESLLYFHVFHCDQLFTKSCQMSGDPNWQKVKHIPIKRFVVNTE